MVICADEQAIVNSEVVHWCSITWTHVALRILDIFTLRNVVAAR